LIASVRSGQSRPLLVRGEAGVGKTALLEFAAERASGCRLARAVGVQAEMELAFAGLHRLLGPMLDHLECLPVGQQEALRIALGQSTGSPPDRFLVGLAVLNLLSEVATDQPLVCLVDDEQWLDRASTQVLAFVARRLEAESVGMVLAARTLSDDLAGLPDLVVEGLSEADAGELLDAALSGPVDPAVRERILKETQGNPLALLEIPRGLTPAELAGGFGLPVMTSLSSGIEDSFRRQLDALPAAAQRFLRLAAADPVGDPVLLWRAADRLAIPADAATPATDAELIEFGAQVRFRHPLVRSTAYRSASGEERRVVHEALAAVTDPKLDPDRRAWHRAYAAVGPDEEVADDLERSAARAQARGGLAAAAAFLERSAKLTPELHRRVNRLLAAAKAKRDAGALEDALSLLIAVEGAPLDALQGAELEQLRGRIAFDQRRAGDAARLLLSAARRLGPLDAASARDTHLEALGAAIWAGEPDGVRTAAEAAHTSPRVEPPRVVDELLDALVLRLTDGYTAAAQAMTRALQAYLALETGPGESGRWLWLAGSRVNSLIARELWDAESLYALAARQVEFARDTGALLHLQFTLALLALTQVLAGELTEATLLIEEDRAIAEATRNPRVPYVEFALAAYRGRESEAAELIEANRREAIAEGLGNLVNAADWASAVLNNSLGRHDAARDAARQAFERDQFSFGPFIVPELAEAASRTGDLATLRSVLDWMSERTPVTRSDWALGIDARLRALLSDGGVAEHHYRESIGRLGRTHLRVEHARAHLLFGEWLRRERRRVDAREHLRTALELFSSMGVEGFAARAQRELLATGETVRRRTPDTRDELTPQELQIARLARDGLSNPEIGMRLFISPRTVQYHLRKVFIKLDIGSRHELDGVLPGDA
jgi:DNA-binding CsgD family transcriptional regulator